MKKLIPALSMLLVSLMLLSTSTYAWFSMNKDATVTGMNVEAQADSQYLLIGTDPEASNVQSKKQTSFTWTLNSKLKPSAFDNKNGSKKAQLDTQANWYTDVATSAGAATGKGNKKALSNFTNYVEHQTLYITMAKGSPDGKNLKVSGTFTAAGGKQIGPVTVYVVAAGGDLVELNSAKYTPVKIADTVTDSTTVMVDIYIFYNGAHEQCFTDNFANLDKCGIELSFAID